MKKLAAVVIILALLLPGCSPKESSYTEGLRLFQEGRYSDATELFERSVSQGNDSADLYTDLALSYRYLGNGEKAEEWMTRALSLPEDERTATVLKKFGLYYDLTGDPAKAREYYLGSVSDPEKLRSGDLDAAGLLADLERREGHYEEAVEWYGKLILESYHPREHKILCGECYLAMHQMSAAYQYFDLLEKDAGAAAKDYVRICNACREYGDLTGFSRYKEIGLRAAEREQAEGFFLSGIGEYANALEKLEKPETYQDHLARAVSLQAMKRYPEAEQAYTDLILLQENLSEVYGYYLGLKIETGDRETALQLLSELRNSDSEEEVRCAAWNEVILSEKTGDYDGAFEKLSDYLKKYPMTEEVRKEYTFLSRLLDR